MLLQTEETLLDIMSQVFPPTNYDYRENIIDAFGYGSGVLSQQQQQQQPPPPLWSSSNDDDHHHHHDKTSSDDPKMIDLILVVNDVQQFHRENIQHNPQHYNFTNNNDYYRYYRNNENNKNDHNWQQQQQQQQRAATITWVQCHSTFSGQSYFSNPGVYFHLVHNNSHQNIGGIKYGIISYQALLNDLQQWTHLYIAGRMHKPIVRIPIHRLCNYNNNNNETTREKQPHSTTPQRCRQVLQSAQEKSNLPAALATALLYQWYQDQQQQQQQQQQSVASTLSTATSDQSSTTTTTFRDLYQHIVQISYSGDPRMGMFEDTQKIQNIITSQYHHFDQLYQPILQPFIHDGLVRVVTTSSSNTPVNDGTTTTGSHDTAVFVSPPEQQQQQMLLTYHWDHPLAHERLWQCLPQRIRQQCRSNNNNHHMTRHNYRNTSTTSSHDNRQQHQENMSAIRQLQTMISRSIIAPAARYQSLKGLYSTGLRNSIVYLTRKFSKGRLGKQFTSYFTTTPSSSSRSTTRVPTATTAIPKKN